jgi:DNA-binding GntR family transcriptional regulator
MTLTVDIWGAPAPMTSKDEISKKEIDNLNRELLKRLTVADLPTHKPDFLSPGASKDMLIAEWLRQWIQQGLDANQLEEIHLLPRKLDIANYLGVSVGTVQNAIRYVEDDGWVESKQRIGTLIRRQDSVTRLRKQTSKRDQAVSSIKQFIIDHNYNPDQFLPSAREVAKLIGSAPNTTRLALEFLSSIGILESLGTRGNKANWLVKQIPTLTEHDVPKAIESQTLIDHLERDLKRMIADEFEIGDKLPSHIQLAERFHVSIKTVHDAMKRLSDQSVIQSKRGRYGTFILRIPTTEFFDRDDVFMPAEQVNFYNYEKAEQQLKELIMSRFTIGDKLPAMGQLSEMLQVSSNTVRKALQSLAKQTIVVFSRGRYGGTFVVTMPTTSQPAEPPIQWVSLNPESIGQAATSAPAADSAEPVKQRIKQG